MSRGPEPRSLSAAKKAEKQKQSGGTAPGTPGDGEGSQRALRRFSTSDSGLFVRRDDELYWICDRLAVMAETQDDAGSWGVQLAWTDRGGAARTQIFPRSLLSGHCKEIRASLAGGGLTMNASAYARQSLTEFLNLASSPVRAISTDRTGWMTLGASRCFVLPDEIVGQADKRIILQPRGELAPFGTAGSLESWKDSVATFSIGNSRLLFAVSAAFAGALLTPMDVDGFGLNLKGRSRTGKSTVLRAAASVWGGTPEGGAAGYVRGWRTTTNGLEGVAVQYADTILPLDEIGVCDPAEIGEIAYMLANGSGKSRAGRDGAARAAAHWRLLFLSTGELGLAELNMEARRQTKAGQELRLIDLPADAGKGFGVFEVLHETGSPEAFSDELRSAVRQNYGVAGRAFLKWLLEMFDRDSQAVDKLRDDVTELARMWLKDLRDPGAQVRSVAFRFGLIATAGELATRAGITGWQAGEARTAAQRLFASWVKSRGSVGAIEDTQAVQQLAAFLSRHGASRFEIWPERRTIRGDDGADLEADTSYRPVHNRAGWRQTSHGPAGELRHVYYFTLEAMKEVTQGLDHLPAVRSLVRAGMITPDREGKSATSVRPPGTEKNVRLFVVPAHAIGGASSLDGHPDDTPPADFTPTGDRG